MKRKHWTTKEGNEIPYSKLEDTHLLNILKWIIKRAAEGMEVVTGGGGGDDIEDIWFDTEYIEGEEVLEKYNYQGLYREAKKRKLL